MHPTSFQSATIPNERLLPGIHGLRGIAALAVVLFHLVHVAHIPPPFAFIASDFGKGVHLFFVLSAFSLMHSTVQTLNRPNWATEYFVKRFWRIAPLFYCVLGATILFSPLIMSHNWSVDPHALLMNLTFTFGFAPWTGIVMAGWTIGVEMLFYVILPVLLLTVRTSKGMLLLVVASILISYASNSTLYAHYELTVPQYRYNWAYFSFSTNLCYFALGMYAYRLSQEIAPSKSIARGIVSTFTVVSLGTLLLAGLGGAWRGSLILWGIGFAALALWQGKWPSSFCANRFFEHVGERSYSVYLLHAPLIALLRHPIQAGYTALSPSMGHYAYFVCAALVVLPILALAELTYRMIEIPAIRYGQTIIRRGRELSATRELQEA